jgi:glycosyltransferase involved in cell wall biosynthesis
MTAFGGDMDCADARRKLLVWGHCSLDKRGSFEDYLLLLSERAAVAGRDVHVVAEGANAAMREAVTARGATLRVIARHRSEALSEIAGEALRLAPDIVHFHFGSPSTMGAPLLRALTLGGARIVVTDHGSRQGAPPRPTGAVDRAKAWRRRASARSVSLYLPVSSFVASRVTAEVGIASARARVLHNGVDLARFSPPPLTANAPCARSSVYRRSASLWLSSEGCARKRASRNFWPPRTNCWPRVPDRACFGWGKVRWQDRWPRPYCIRASSGPGAGTT